MKLTFVTSVVALALGVQVAPAQTKMIANVPFEFQAGNTRMPSGQYSIAKTIDNVLVMMNMETKETFVQLSSPTTTAKTPEKGRLVFNRRGDAYFLHQVWAARDANGCALQTSKREAELKRAKPESETVVVAATR